MMRMLTAVFVIVLLAGCNTVTPHLNVYDSLLPAGYVVKDSPDPFRASALRHKTVAIVTTTNFDHYTQQWIEYYEQGGAERRQKKMGFMADLLSMGTSSASIGTGMNKGLGSWDANLKANRQASDPRILVDRIGGLLKRNFRRVKTAKDFSDARRQKVDYIALVDYHFTANAMGDAFSGHAGVYLLDSKIRRVFEVKSAVEVARGNDISGALTTQRVLNTTVGQVVSGLDAHLHPGR